MARPTSTAISFGLFVLAACGGKVVVDQPGAGGSGTTTGTTTIVGSCEALQADLDAKNAAALSCNPYMNMMQCDGTAVVVDECGCTIVANELQPDAVAAASAAYSAWVQAGCGPTPCYTCPPGPEAGAYCDSTSSKCQVAYKK